MCYNLYGDIMADQVIEVIYYIPDKVKRGGNFYHEFAGIGEFLPNSIEPLLETMPGDLSLDDVPSFLKQKYSITVRRLGGAIPKNGTTIKPYIAYTSSQLNFVNKEQIKDSCIREIKDYCTYTLKKEEKEYKEKKLKYNI